MTIEIKPEYRYVNMIPKIQKGPKIIKMTN